MTNKQIDTTAESNGLRLVTQGSHPSAPSSGHALLYHVTGTANPGLYVQNSGGEKKGPLLIINDRRWSRGSPANSLDDEFNDGSINGSWGRVDNSGHDGYVTWTESGDSLSLLLGNTADAAAELHAYLKSYAMSIGDYIQCHIVGGGKSQDYPLAGLIITDGNTYGAGAQAFFPYFQTNGAPYDLSPSEWSGFNNRVAFTDNNSSYFGTACHLRLKYDASNSFKYYHSPDGISWTLIGTRSITLTPTHIGVAGSTYGGSTPYVFSFDYFRINP
jgi:hypothetical protein